MKKSLLALSLVAVTSFSASAADKVLAKVNGTPITESQLREVLNRLPASYSSLKSNPSFRQHVLNTLINQQLLYQEARKENVEKDKTVQRQIEEVKKQILINALLSKHLKVNNVKVSDKEAKAFYEKNKFRFIDANKKLVPFKSVKPKIFKFLKQQKMRQAFRMAFNNYISKLRKANKVEIVK